MFLLVTNVECCCPVVVLGLAKVVVHQVHQLLLQISRCHQ